MGDGAQFNRSADIARYRRLLERINRTIPAHDPAAPEPGAGTREALAGVLAEHRIVGPACTCGWKVPPSVPWLPTHEAHVAAALAPEVARIEAEAREAERERIAAAIEDVDPVEWALLGQHAGTEAAKIARSRP